MRRYLATYVYLGAPPARYEVAAENYECAAWKILEREKLPTLDMSKLFQVQGPEAHQSTGRMDGRASSSKPSF